MISECNQKFGFLTIAVAFCLWFLSCDNLDTPPEDPEYDVDIDIMPDADGFINNDNSLIPIQGTWYWYQNIGSKINKIKVYAQNLDGGKLWYDPEAKPNQEDKETLVNGNTTKVDRICVEGEFELSEGEESAGYGERYVGIGFELCSTNEYGPGLYQFPHTLGTCPLGGENTLISRFLGVSFTIEPFPQSDDLEFEKFIVQFKERGEGLDAQQPYCVVKDDTENDNKDAQRDCRVTSEEEDEFRVEAWYGNAISPNRDIESGLEERNLWALQGVHFQVESDEDGEFSFCLSDIGAIATLSNREGEDFGEELFVNTDVDLEKPKDIIALEDLTNGEDSRMDSWVDAKFNGDSGGDTDSDTGTDTDIDTDPDAEFSDDSEDTNDYPDDKPFQIMTKEVSVEQYYKCYDEYEVCGEIRGWESCNVHRYRLIMEADGDDESEDLEELGKKAANCVNWYDARQFCKLIGGDLPTKEQWEYAARSGYKNATQFPWGEETVDCEKAIIYDGQGKGCGNNGVPEEGCSLYPEGRTETGVCDMIGNLWEWVKDDYSDDGASWQKDYKTIKGGGFNTTNIIVGMESESYLSITKSTSLEHPVEPHNPNRLGFRCIRYIEDSKNTDEEDDKGKNEDKDQDEK